ncbi:MAG: endo alpha-1,4 polygalactosaminidase [Alphaproteobacteria bacterium]|nr:endo alpha-1,4 polygalactosaminidase [Alphaproteobacteria bacterium]MCB9695517.1 endo alpha-1,4 polygalactosaminidase [Alphaproteobacteria bacterium]
MRSILLVLVGCHDVRLAPPEGEAELLQGCVPGSACAPIEVGTLPATLSGDTRTDGEDEVDAWSCAPTTSEAGREVWYAVDVAQAGTLRASVDDTAGDGVDVDVHLLAALDPDACVARDNAVVERHVDPGTVYVVVDTWAGRDGTVYDGPYTLSLDFDPDVAEPGSPAPTGGVWVPPPGTTWQWQLSGAIDASVEVAVYDIDLFDVSDATLRRLRDDGRAVICYFSAGSREDWRDDADRFLPADLGRPLEGWAGERWIDVRSANVREIMRDRLQLAADRGCDAVEPDNVDGYANANGLGLTRADQLDYLRFLADEAHARGLSVGLKNALGLVPELADTFDWALNEECVAYDECGALDAFLDRGKAVFHVEYVDRQSQGASARDRVCADRQRDGFSTLVKTWDLDAWRLTCPGGAR